MNCFLNPRNFKICNSHSLFNLFLKNIIFIIFENLSFLLMIYCIHFIRSIIAILHCLLRTHCSDSSLKFWLRTLQSFLRIIANKRLLEWFLWLFLKFRSRVKLYFMLWLFQVEKRLTKLIRLFEGIEVLVNFLYIWQHFPDEMRVMRLHILGLLHRKHFVMYG